jgi:hypothetical protein
MCLVFIGEVRDKYICYLELAEGNMKIKELLLNESPVLNELDTRPDDNFNAADLQRLNKMTDLNQAKDYAKSLVTRPSKKPMKPNKVAWFSASIDKARSIDELAKIMWSMLMSGEGMPVIGTRSSMDKSSYRKQFGEDAGSSKLERAYDLDIRNAMTPDGKIMRVNGRDPAELNQLPIGSIVMSHTIHDDGDSRKASSELYKKVADLTDTMTPAFQFMKFLDVSPYAKGPEVAVSFQKQASALI